MTLGQCLDEIRKLHLGGEIQAMGNLGMKLVRKIKRDYFLDEELPRNGWFLFYGQDGELYIVNKHVRVQVFAEEEVSEQEMIEEALAETPIKNYRNILHVTFPKETQTKNN